MQISSIYSLFVFYLKTAAAWPTGAHHAQTQILCSSHVLTAVVRGESAWMDTASAGGVSLASIVPFLWMQRENPGLPLFFVHCNHMLTLPFTLLSLSVLLPM